jgi:predicted O-methyltransferase YrrM
MSLIDRLIAEQPAFHAWPDGKAANWSIAGEPLRYLYDCLKPGMATLETGAGQSTVAFAIAGTNHVCITPDEAQAERIRNYCRASGIATPITFVHESSDTALPAGRNVPDELDLVLIDGAHRFPFPILDWYYTQARLKVGGVVVVDDYPMPSVKILHDFLAGEDEWKLERAFQRTSFFRRTRETVSQWDWADQNINQSAKRPASVPPLKQPAGAVRRLLRAILPESAK